MMKIAPAVAMAGAESGVASRPITDFDAYEQRLQSFVYASGNAMKPIFSVAKRAERRRVAFAEGEDRRVLRAVQVIVDEGLAKPWLVGRAAIIESRIEKGRPAAEGRARLRGGQHRRRQAATATTGRPTTG